MLITTEGIVLREKPFRENDKFIDVLTREYGVIEILIRGVRKITSKNCASSQLFAYSRFCIEKKGERFYLNSCEPIHIFYEIRLDVEKLALASYFSEILQFAVPANEPAEEIVRLLLNSLHFLTEGKRSIPLIKSIFELRLAADIGMMPDLVGCRECAAFSAEEMYFDVQSGVLYCEKCCGEFQSQNELILLTPSLLHAVRYIVLTDFEKLWDFSLSEQAQKRLNAVSENYLTAHLGRSFKTLDFYKSLLPIEEAM